jgi:transcriptional regulator with XRE-family HTH domain
MTVLSPGGTHVNSQEMVYFKALGARIAQARKRMGFTQQQLADQLGIAQQTFANYEAGLVRFPASTLPLLGQLLDLSPEELLGHDARPKLKRGPASRLDQQIERIRQLPRATQQVLVKMLDGVLAEASH